LFYDIFGDMQKEMNRYKVNDRIPKIKYA